MTIRQHHETPILSAASMSALLCPAFASLLDVGTNGLLKLFLFGTIHFGRGLILLMIVGQMVSATENASPFVPTNRFGRGLMLLMIRGQMVSRTHRHSCPQTLATMVSSKVGVRFPYLCE